MGVTKANGAVAELLQRLLIHAVPRSKQRIIDDVPPADAEVQLCLQ
eukprot:CAMPEP_0194556408 /NCGR_PEP_ID=MMETSP0253-20130528/98728_1 /TAXON_ID=2966 /ORGANISM="Noctiluca scintillans" /LENGTH=45 /DNA_ID= /DNA_START= /DNA_END= /DNA_ORIENTATION=